MSIDAPPTQQGDEVKTTLLKILISHMVETLKSISQQAHNFYVTLQSAEQFYNEALSWLSPAFNLWGPYTQFLDRLIVLMAKKLDFLDKIITVKEGLELFK